MFSPRRPILLRLLAEGRLALLKWFVIRFTIWLEGRRRGLGRGAPLAVIGADGVEPGSRKCGDSHTSEKVITPFSVRTMEAEDTQVFICT